MRFLRRVSAWILVWSGLMVLCFSLWQISSTYQHQSTLTSQALQLIKLLLQKDVQASAITNKVPIEVEFPRLQHKVVLAPSQIINGQWQVSGDLGNYLIGSGVIGEPGNAVLYAHQRDDLFGNLDKLVTGDIIIIRTPDLVTEYTVISSQVVSATNIDVLSDSPRSLLTLYTCHGWADRHRLVLQAQLTKKYLNSDLLSTN